MIVIKLELWPRGDESRKIDLGTAHISNVSNGSDLSAYDVRLLKGERYSKRPGELYKAGKVPFFPRRDKRWGPWELLALALEETVGTRIASLRKYLSGLNHAGRAPQIGRRASELTGLPVPEAERLALDRLTGWPDPEAYTDDDIARDIAYVHQRERAGKPEGKASAEQLTLTTQEVPRG